VDEEQRNNKRAPKNGSIGRSKRFSANDFSSRGTDHIISELARHSSSRKTRGRQIYRKGYKRGHTKYIKRRYSRVRKPLKKEKKTI
jgi:hypothetical protein